jgi:membrane associated rhomboid family serine protease
MILNIIIIAITSLISIQAFNNYSLFEKLKFNAYKIKHDKESWRFFTYALVHGGWGHLLINMFVLWSFGSLVERNFSLKWGIKGEFYFILLYVSGVLFSTLMDFYKNKDKYYYNAVGASGAVSAIVFASILIHPGGSVFVFPIPIPIPSWLFGILYLVYSAYMAKKGTDNVGHTAHFWGAVVGIVFMLVFDPEIFASFFGYFFN